MGNSYTALSPERQDVLDAINQATTGDTVFIPAGTAVWTQAIGVNRGAINIVGAGSGLDGTILIDENPSRTSGTLIRLVWTTIGTDDVLTLSNIRFKGGTVQTGAALNGLVRIIGSSDLTFTNNNSWRIHDCYFDRPNGRPIEVQAFTGLIDHCFFDCGGQVGVTFDGRLQVGPVLRGHQSWAEPVLIGTHQEGVYMEDCEATATTLRGITDGFAGSRVICRYCRLHNRSVENHGTESTQVARGGRWLASYNNIYSRSQSTESPCLFRSGSGVVFNNTLLSSADGAGYVNWSNAARMAYLRSTDTFKPYGEAHSQGDWDVNDPVVYGTGTHVGTDGSLTTVTVAGDPWITDQWNGYHFYNTNPTSWGSAGTLWPAKAALCIGNTTNTATFHVLWSTNSQMHWHVGDNFEIRKVIRGLDQPGNGSGDLLHGTSDTTPPTPVGWPNQASEPIYIWDNVNNSGGSVGGSGSGYYMIERGRDFFDDGTPHPTYVPYTYPHPLQSGTVPPPPPSPPIAPSGLGATTFSSTQINLSWTDNSSDETDFRLERSTLPTSGFAEVITLGADVTSYSDTGLTPNTTYYYRVRAHSTAGNSAYTATANATTSGIINPPPRGRRATGMFPRIL